MDKAQKQLFDTYFRKRNIANNQPEAWEGQYNENAFTYYETEYLLTHDTGIRVDSSSVDIYISNEPKSKLEKINMDTLSPKALTTALEISCKFFYDRVKPERIAELNGNQIFWIVYNHPDCADKFDLSKIDDSNDIYRLAKMAYDDLEYPDIINKLNLKKMNSRDISLLLHQFPNLSNHFK